MIRLTINEEIKIRHSLYIISMNLEKKLIEFYNKYSCNKNINNKFDKELNRFVYFIIGQVNDLRKIIDEKDYKKNNIFISEPKILYGYIKYIKSKFPQIYKIFKSKDYFAIDFRKEFINILGYNKFIKNDTFINYIEIKKLFDKFNSEKKIREFLRKDNVNKRGRDYNIDDLNKIFEYIINRIKELEALTNDDNLINLMLKEFKREFCSINDILISQGSNIINVRKICNIFIKYRIEFNKYIGEDNLTIDKYSRNFKKNKYSLNQWGAYHYVFLLGLRSCPYCNRQYITPLYSESGKVRGDLDHFFAKSQYPYLSMSIYNLIPACSSCNSSLKGTEEFSYNKNLNPFEYGISEIMKFDYEPTSYRSFYGEENVKVILEERDNVDKELLDKAKSNIETFKIKELYQYHSKVINDLILKKMLYSNEYIEYEYNRYRYLFSSIEEVKNFIYLDCVKDNDLDENLAVLKRDIYEALNFYD